VRRWIAGRIADILGNDDDVVIELCCNLIESARHVRTITYPRDYAMLNKILTRLRLQPDIKSLQIQLTGFLESHTPEFCKELWTLLLSAQSSPQGIPRELLEAKKMELIQEKVGQTRALHTTGRQSIRALVKTKRSFFVM
jgi:serine/arginine repetitive matrix protein 1